MHALSLAPLDARPVFGTACYFSLRAGLRTTAGRTYEAHNGKCPVSRLYLLLVLLLNPRTPLCHGLYHFFVLVVYVLFSYLVVLVIILFP
jgi:hypothetical protein